MKKILSVLIAAVAFSSCATLPKNVSLHGDDNCAQLTLKVPSKQPVTVYYCDTANINKIERLIKEAIKDKIK